MRGTLDSERARRGSTDDPFADLLDLRGGGIHMTMGAESSIVTAVTDGGQWERKSAALRDLFVQTLGTLPLIECPLDLRIEEEHHRQDHLERRVSYQLEPDER